MDLFFQQQSSTHLGIIRFLLLFLLRTNDLYSVIVVGCHTGDVFAFNSYTRELLWSLSSSSSQAFTRPVLMSPLFVGDQVIVGSTNGDIASIRIQTGQMVQKKKKKTKGELSTLLLLPPTIDLEVSSL